MDILFPLLLITFTMLIIWRASDGFEAASDYIGRNLSDGVKGATINAVASSLPELFTTLFFLFYLKDVDGFSGGIGTTAGSAIFNGMIIPAFVILAVLIGNVAKGVEVSKKVILRDGISLIIAELILIILISGTSLKWWHGFTLMITYGVYVTYMLTSMEKNENSEEEEEDDDEENDEEINYGKALLTLDLESLIIGKNKINNSNAWSLLSVAVLVIAAACMLLVHACEQIGTALDMPIIFVSVVLAAAASSVPDTIISMKDARKGNYDDAVANALGSNIFDICFALGLPLFLYTIIHGDITMDANTIRYSSELRVFLLLLTIVTFFWYLFSKKMAMGTVVFLLAIYGFFLFYVFGRTYENQFAIQIGDFLHLIMDYIPTL
ncbi:MAG: pseudouridine synthase [Bacteroidetes bacterium 4572_128]|nr:MAG: pseudouridine synthase [Bacteroidetes bacterium 4572_128]